MKKIILPLGVALIQMLSTAAFAQSSSEADPAQAKARPTPKTTPSWQEAQYRLSRYSGE